MMKTIDLTFDIKNNWLIPAKHILSPNANPRPVGSDISLLVVHNISLPPGEFGGHYVVDFFTNQLEVQAHAYFTQIAQLHVSSHLFIRRTGEVIQFVPFNLRAWHAGESSFQGRDNCNDYSIGIELEGTDDLPYEEQQYSVLAAVIQRLQDNYPAIDHEHIVGHSDVAPGRKTDPGKAFDWIKLFALLNEAK